MPRPDLSRVFHFYHKYINLVVQDDLMLAFETGSPALFKFLEEIPADKRDYRYGPGKWTIREMIQHLVDSERVFSYRAMCFARGEKQPLPGFDENAYAVASRAESRDWEDLITELDCLRKATILLFRSLNSEQLESGGIASGYPNYTNALGFVILGHCEHHLQILRERYL